eukprot:TRINITY_DN12485_c0_g1_i2.p1 TRINITY_DN12485_c0_g1~~TRINITY_DN12485_c0_g1_i2.p1  ORF type:complete len:121 (+),score=23.56 TRINITY_DN12485_c0_g1_i2:66-428(+)
MIRRPPRSTLSSSSAASDVYKRQHVHRSVFLDIRDVQQSLEGGEEAQSMRKWTRRHDGRPSYRERGVSQEDWEVYWTHYCFERYVEYGRPAVMPSDWLVMSALLPEAEVLAKAASYIDPP